MVRLWRISDKERQPKNPLVTAAFWPIASIVESREFRECAAFHNGVSAPTHTRRRLPPTR